MQDLLAKQKRGAVGRGGPVVSVMHFHFWEERMRIEGHKYAELLGIFSWSLR